MSYMNIYGYDDLMVSGKSTFNFVKNSMSVPFKTNTLAALANEPSEPSSILKAMRSRGMEINDGNFYRYFRELEAGSYVCRTGRKATLSGIGKEAYALIKNNPIYSKFPAKHPNCYEEFYLLSVCDLLGSHGKKVAEVVSDKKLYPRVVGRLKEAGAVVTTRSDEKYFMRTKLSYRQKIPEMGKSRRKVLSQIGPGPVSSSKVGSKVKLSNQTVNYHARNLIKMNLLKEARPAYKISPTGSGRILASSLSKLLFQRMWASGKPDIENK